MSEDSLLQSIRRASIMTTRRPDCVKGAQLYGLFRENSAEQQLTEEGRVKKQRRSGWMKVGKGEVEVRKMAVAAPIPAACPHILYAYSGSGLFRRL